MIIFWKRFWVIFLDFVYSKLLYSKLFSFELLLLESLDLSSNIFLEFFSIIRYVFALWNFLVFFTNFFDAGAFLILFLFLGFF